MAPGGSTFELHLEGPRVTLERLARSARAALALLREVDSEITRHAGGALEWVVEDLRSGSAHISAFPEVKHDNIPSNAVEKILDSVGQGLEEIESEARRPRYFTDSALEMARELTGALRDEGIIAVTIRTNGVAVSLTTRLAANVDELISGKLKSIGSVEGRLETISLHGKEFFSVYEALTGKAVRCYFPRKLLDRVKEALSKRVQVSGTIWTTRTGETVSIQVDSIEIFPEESDLPSARTVRGLLDG